MTMSVLQSKAQIRAARESLQRRGLSWLDSPARRLLRRLCLDRSIGWGDLIKSWDVLNSVEFIEQHLPPHAAILDIGAYASEILNILVRLQYTNLSGVDLNPKLSDSPHAGLIRYEIADFLATPFHDASFDAVTAISVIEHGFQQEKLLREMARLIRPNGFFIASFDYWPAKIDTRAQRFFDLDWLIFSAQEVREFIAGAQQHGFVPFGPLSFDATSKPISCAGYQYTFGWIVLQKLASPGQA